MYRLTVLFLLIVVLSPLSIAAAFLWQQGATQVQVTGHVYETAKLEPTDERINQLKLPPGFKIAKFALLAAIKGHVLAKGEIVGTYQRGKEETVGKVGGK
ncbi:MAG: hypothetical protein M3X11_07305 [Acidobacteriota bacterium]|nr:hypothetical protein [Acidobacteriota bacterium]